MEDFGLVNFATLSIEDKESVTRLVRLTDKCVGYVNAGGFSRATANEAAAGESPSRGRSTSAS